MANTTPRRRTATTPAPKPRKASDVEAPWNDADETRKVAINVPFPEPLMAQLDYLVQNRAIHSKSSFIRDVVAEAATNEIEKLRRVQAAVKLIESQDAKRK